MTIDNNSTNVRGEFPGTPASGGSTAFSTTDGAVIARVLKAAGVTGISANNGRGVNADLYVAYINQVSKTAGDAAVASWLAGH